MVRLLSLLICATVLTGAGVADGGYDFRERGDALSARGTSDSLEQAVVEYTSAILESPRDARAIAARSGVLADLGDWRGAVHDADTALIHGGDELSYCWVVGRSMPSIALLRRGLRLACASGDRTLIPAIGRLLLFYETRYLYVTDKQILP